ncbi:MAG TPA: hypothetical protein VLA72_04130 [Anaerolineales bacterium]|nr:hypothetical protein [Anaerolineales bacterium]
MDNNNQNLSDEYIKLAFAIEEYQPGYIDSYFGPEELKTQAAQAGKLPLQELTDKADQLANNISQAEMDSQRKDFLARQVTAMKMSLRLLAGKTVPLAEEVKAIYDVQPEWVNESQFEEAHKELDSLLPQGDSIPERMQAWNRSLEISIEKAKELLPAISKRLKDITVQKFDLPDGESFSLEWVSDKPWAGYNWYLGNYKSRIDINSDVPVRINRLPDLMAHEGYPGHHTELSIKDEKLVQQKKFREHTIALINSPSCVTAEGIATSALETVLTDNQLEDWYRQELLPRVGLSHIDPKRILEIGNAGRKMGGIMGNVSFMLFDQSKDETETKEYLRKHGLATEQEINHAIRFVTEPLSRSYVFTYDIGYDLLEELFIHVDRDTYFKRLLEEPVTPSQVRQWIADAKTTSN